MKSDCPDGVLARFLDGALDPAQKREVEAHLSSCDVCRGRLARLERTLSIAGEALAAPPPSNRVLDEVHSRIRRDGEEEVALRFSRMPPFWVSATAAAAVLLAAIGIVAVRSQERTFERTAAVPEDAKRAGSGMPLVERWTRRFPGCRGLVRGADGNVWVWTADDDPMLLRGETGRKVREVGLRKPPVAEPDVSGTTRGIVVEAEDNGALHGRDEATGRKLWRVPPIGEPCLPPAVRGNNLYVVSRSGRLRALSLQDGRLLWETVLDAPASHRPAVTAELVLVAADSGRLYVFSRKDGRLVQTTSVPAEPVCAPVAAAGRVFLASEDGTVSAYDLAR